MRFKNIVEQVQSTYTRDGITVPVTKEQTVSMPALPIDWRRMALRGAISIVLLLTLITVTWSTYSIGNLLHGGVGYAAAIIFDLGWAVALLLEYLAQYDRRKRDFPKKLGWGLLIVTMVAIAWDGYNHGSIAMAVIGALVSLFAKCLWLGVMKHINAELSPEDEAWVADQLSAAQAKAAVAQMRRQAGRTEQNAALELLAMERERAQVAEAFGLAGTDVPELATFVSEPSAPEISPPTIADLNKTDAVRLVLRQHPDMTADDIWLALEPHRDDIDVRTIRKIVGRIESEFEAETEPEAEVIELRK